MLREDVASSAWTASRKKASIPHIQSLVACVAGVQREGRGAEFEREARGKRQAE